jgi:hypothetical protein
MQLKTLNKTRDMRLEYFHNLNWNYAYMERMI